MTQPAQDSPATQRVAEFKQAHDHIMTEMARVIVGQKSVIEQILIGLLCRGHCLLEGMPGLAKTSIIRTLARLLDLKFQRIQFTPDLMPADIIGTEIIEQDPSGRRSFRFIKGPVFANVILADEINRTPPKTQAALLESMQELHVTAAGNTYPLDPPFLVLGTQNPIDQEGTYPLPEAQLDRFMLKILVDYPNQADEIRIAEAYMSDEQPTDRPLLTRDQIGELQHIVRQVIVSRHVSSYAVSLARATRPTDPDAPDFISRWVNWGASPRASQFMLAAGRARAILDGRLNVSCDDIRAMAPPVLRHRLGVSFTAESENISVETIIQKVIEAVPEPIPHRGEG
jgi:MoxR-like ATPase